LAGTREEHCRHSSESSSDGHGALGPPPLWHPPAAADFRFCRHRLEQAAVGGVRRRPRTEQEAPPQPCRQASGGSGASAYGTADVCSAPTRTDRRGRSARPTSARPHARGDDRRHGPQRAAGVVGRVQVGGRIDVGRVHPADLDARARGELEAQGLGEAGKASLAGAVARRPGHRHPAEDRGDVDDHATATPLEEVRQRRVGPVYRAEQVQFDQARLRFERDLFESKIGKAACLWRTLRNG
jgi:hypothetical protein